FASVRSFESGEQPMVGRPVRADGVMPVARRLTSAGLSSASCSPVLNGLQTLIGLENGAFIVLLIPGGKSGAERKPIARSVNAIVLLSGTPKFCAATAYWLMFKPFNAPPKALFMV